MASVYSRWLVFQIMSLVLGTVSAQPALSAEPRVIGLTVADGHFTPEIVTAPANEKFKLLIKNSGKTAEEFESRELNREKVVPPGQMITIFLGPLNVGEYSFFGDFHAETAKGKIVVK